MNHTSKDSGDISGRTSDEEDLQLTITILQLYQEMVEYVSQLSKNRLKDLVFLATQEYKRTGITGRLTDDACRKIAAILQKPGSCSPAPEPLGRCRSNFRQMLQRYQDCLCKIDGMEQADTEETSGSDDERLSQEEDETWQSDMQYVIHWDQDGRGRFVLEPVVDNIDKPSASGASHSDTTAD